MATKDTSEAPASKKTALDLAKEAQAEIQVTMTDKRIDLLTTMLEFKGVGGEDDIQAGILKIAAHFKEGIPYPFLQSVYPEIPLTKARDELVKNKKIVQEGKKGKRTIKLVEVAAE
ncbi:MAG: hypothetical protein ABMA13_00905 [Chthoniobacteraceae bacterium]